jgi:type II secretory pathway pseudopilin PulG
VSRRRRWALGFTLVEIMISMVMLGIVVGSVAALVISQTRNLGRVTGDVQALDQVRTAQEMLGNEIATLPRGAVQYAAGDSVSYHLPIVWGVICGAIDRTHPLTITTKKTKTTTGATVFVYSDTVAMQYEPDADALGTPTPDGFALSSDGVTFAFYPLANYSSLGITSDTAAASACMSLPPILSTKKKKKPGKKDAPPVPDSTVVGSTADFYRAGGIKAAVGGQVGERTLMFAYLDVGYKLRTDSAGGRILYRGTKYGAEKLAWPFTASAAFAFRLDDGTTVGTVSGLNLARIRAIQTTLPAIRTQRGKARADTLNLQPWLYLYNAR